MMRWIIILLVKLYPLSRYKAPIRASKASPPADLALDEGSAPDLIKCCKPSFNESLLSDTRLTIFDRISVKKPSFSYGNDLKR